MNTNISYKNKSYHVFYVIIHRSRRNYVEELRTCPCALFDSWTIFTFGRVSRLVAVEFVSSVLCLVSGPPRSHWDGPRTMYIHLVTTYIPVALRVSADCFRV